MERTHFGSFATPPWLKSWLSLLGVSMRSPLSARLEALFASGLAGLDALPAAQTLPAGVAVAPARVLVVDDDEVNRLLVCEILAQWGIAPKEASDGAEAVALACGLDFDLILMDLQMPILDGLGATKQIRRYEQETRRGRVPVVAHTSSEFGRNAELLASCGVDDVLHKPCDVKGMASCLLRWCPPAGAFGTRLPSC